MPNGVNKHYGAWRWARVPCPPEAGAAVGEWCDVKPRDHFGCCNWPWDIPKEMHVAANERRQRLAPLSPRRRAKGKGKGKGKGRRAARAARAAAA